MPLAVRGFNPIWSEFNLAGKLFDGSYYMYVLMNTIPYIPATVWHDPDMNVPWTSPIQFLANGTLPIDIYFDSEVVYRLEFRKNNGIDPPSQADALIYEVNNYIAGSGGSTPVDTLAFASSNQVTNPQFALINFVSPYSYSGPAASLPIAGEINVAPGWTLELTGTGTVVLTQVPLNNDEINPSNAPYALRLTLTGWDADSVFLRQRFEQNGMLWANKIVSTAITARVQGASQNISASLIDSNDSTLAIVLDAASTVIDESFNEFTGYGQLSATTNPDVPPAAFIDYKLALPNNVDIYVTSIQLVVQDLPVEPRFEQDSINRQIDHTYNTAYPIVPIGTVIDYYGFGTPDHYLSCNGAAINRTQYQLLFSKVTHIETVTLTSGSPTITVADGSLYYITAPVEGVGIPASTLITNIVGNTITLGNNATVSGAEALTFFAVGNGNGSTTFNVPLLQGIVIAGAGGTTLFPAGRNGVGYINGSATTTLLSTNMPVGTPTNGGSSLNSPSQVPVGTPNVQVPFSTTPYGQGSATAISIVQPTALAQKMIRFE